ncbi:hypothetical protein F2P79_012843 [Pimephales promelas]|nr:hypothetical protein F2P79_012843 [Pimephales promelas]
MCIDGRKGVMPAWNIMKVTGDSCYLPVMWLLNPFVKYVDRHPKKNVQPHVLHMDNIADRSLDDVCTGSDSRRVSCLLEDS